MGLPGKVRLPGKVGLLRFSLEMSFFVQSKKDWLFFVLST